MFNFKMDVTVLGMGEKSPIYYAGIKGRLPFKYLQSLRRMALDS